MHVCWGPGAAQQHRTMLGCAAQAQKKAWSMAMQLCCSAWGSAASARLVAVYVLQLLGRG